MELFYLTFLATSAAILILRAGYVNYAFAVDASLHPAKLIDF